MAFHLKAVLGDLLCLEVPDSNRSTLPSPFELRRKILIKAKKQISADDSAHTNVVQLASEATKVMSGSDQKLLDIGEIATTTTAPPMEQMGKKRALENIDLRSLKEKHHNTSSTMSLKSVMSTSSSSKSSEQNNNSNSKGKNRNRSVSYGNTRKIGSMDRSSSPGNLVHHADSVSADFSALVNYCESVKFKGFDSNPRKYFQMSSFEETKVKKKFTIR